MLCTSSFIFIGLIAINGAHHIPTCYHEGDELPKRMDFGIFQMSAVVDRHDFINDKNNHFIDVITFGHHTLHHLFPTIDQGLLRHLEPIFLKTCEEFDLKFREFSWWTLTVGQFRQLFRDKPNRLKY